MVFHFGAWPIIRVVVAMLRKIGPIVEVLLIVVADGLCWLVRKIGWGPV